ncbi:hypothetical protein [Aureimonas leprariae]|uniref:Uncharacterized protein n=1 Tax=Plantimonas leprariae TaxID=2615207 RepID=A0A7V7PRL5_9HYPH|nr:hypothetical protein [Aureimonas leprariae]KAB0681419.1 hypothetical protein F6X38_05915 [Aureimonas leprariae]
MTATLATVCKGGGRYDAVWVERLFRGARRFAPAFERFVCLTDLALDVPGVERVPLERSWPAWWSKLEAFRPGLFDGTTVLCDLDTVFAGDASRLAEPGLAAMEDFFHKGRLSSALMRWSGDELGFVHAAFAAEPERWMRAGSCGPVPNAVHGDQVVIDFLLRREGVRPRFFQEAHPGLIDFYEPANPTPGPVVVFIGDSKPDRAEGPVATLWRGEDGRA